MTRSVEFIYDFTSIPCYIAWKALPAMLHPLGATMICTPVLTAGIFKAIGNPGPLALPAKRAWYSRDLARWAVRRGVTLHPGMKLPFRSLGSMRGSVLAQQRGEEFRYMDAMFDALYAKGMDLEDAAVVDRVLRDAGLDAGAYRHGIEQPQVKSRLRELTNDAVERGVFGVPSFFVGDELFFGQDRLEFVVDALQGC